MYRYKSWYPLIAPCPVSTPCSRIAMKHAHLNLLTITAIIKITSTVMMATVTILLVAILEKKFASVTCLDALPQTRKIPSRHALQRLITPVRVTFTLQ
jgi:hypothetical protein